MAPRISPRLPRTRRYLKRAVSRTWLPAGRHRRYASKERQRTTWNACVPHYPANALRANGDMLEHREKTKHIYNSSGMAFGIFLNHCRW